MFRINKIFENYQTEIIKVEGEIKDSDAKDWAASLQSIMNESPRQIILDFCDATFVSSKAVEILIRQMTQNIFLLNCPTAVKNLVHAAGRPESVLEQDGKKR
jgi:anti-anti-sigma regulatory factor